MTLIEFIQENPTADLTTVQEHTEEEKRMIGNKTMALYIDSVGLYLHVHDIAYGLEDTTTTDVEGNTVVEPHPAKEACLLIVNTLKDGSVDGYDFNFIQGTAKGDGVIAKTEHLRDVTLVAYKPQVSTLLSLCIAHCNQVTLPFSEVTQEELDETLADIHSTGMTDATVFYDVVGGAQSFHVRTAANKTLIEVVLDEPSVCDTELSVYVLKKSGITGEFVEVTQPIYVSAKIPKGSTSTFITLESNYGRHTQYRVEANRLGALTALVTSISKY